MGIPNGASVLRRFILLFRPNTGPHIQISLTTHAATKMKRTLTFGLLLGATASAQLIHPLIFFETSSGARRHKDENLKGLDACPEHEKHMPKLQQPPPSFLTLGQIRYSCCTESDPVFREATAPLRNRLLNLPSSDVGQSSDPGPGSPKQTIAADKPVFLAPGVVAEPGPVIPINFPPAERQSLKDCLAEQAEEHAEGLSESGQSSSDSGDSSGDGEERNKYRLAAKGRAENDQPSSDSSDSSDDEDPREVTPPSHRTGNSKGATGRGGADSDGDDRRGIDGEDEEEDRLEEAEEVLRREGTAREITESSGFGSPLAKNGYLQLAL